MTFRAAAIFFILSSSVSAQTIFTADFNDFTAPGGNFNGGQFESGLAVAFSGDLPAWGKSGGGTVHAVDTANVFADGINNPRDFAVMIWQDNVITLMDPIPGSNDVGNTYAVEFIASPTVYQAPGQVTTDTDGLLIEVLRPDDSVLAEFTHQPGAWAGDVVFVPDSFEYTGDGSGDIRLRIGPSAFNSGHFGGAIDDVVVSIPNSDAPQITTFTADPTVLADAGDAVTFDWTVEMPLDALVLTPGDIDVLPDTDGSGEGSFTLDPGPDGTTDYTLTATRDGQRAQRTLSVNLPAPEILSFEASPSGAGPGDALTLSWEVGLPVSSLVITPGDLDVVPDTNAAGVGSITLDPGPSETTAYTLTATRGTSTSTAIATRSIVDPNAILFEDFNGLSVPNPGNFNGGQFESGLAVVFGGDLEGWSKSGLNAVHAVDQANVHPDNSNPRNFSAMIWQDNVITRSSAIPGSNQSGVSYSFAFEAGPAVYQAGSQQTSDTDGILIEILRGDDTVLATHTHLPGAWAGAPTLVPDGFEYIGDGSGDIRIRIGPSAPGSGRFGGAIDNLSLTTTMTVLFQITDLELDAQTDAAIITFTSVDGVPYLVEASTDLLNWQELDDSVVGTGDTTKYTDSFFAPDNPLRVFYRVSRP